MSDQWSAAGAGGDAKQWLTSVVRSNAGLREMKSTIFQKMSDRLLWIINRSARYAGSLGWRRGIHLAWLDRPGSTRCTKLEWPGYARPVTIRLGGSDLRTFLHVIASDGYAFPFSLDREPTVVVDAGANTGLSALWFATKYPKAIVLSIEPSPDNFELLVENTRHLPNVVPICAALWSETGTVSLLDPGQGPWAYRVAESKSDARQLEVSETDVISAIDVPTLMATYGVDHIDILKIDIEGSEREVFEDAAGWIDRVHAIVIELHDRIKPGCSRSFFAATPQFTREAVRDEDVFVAR